MLEFNYNGVTLAYIGDAVIELAIREALIASGVTDTGRLSAAAQKYRNCNSSIFLTSSLSISHVTITFKI